MKIVVLAPAAAAAGSRPALGLSLDGHQWLLLDATAKAALPAAAADDAPLAVVLTDARVDRASGLLGLRDGRPIELYATPSVFERLSVDLPVLPVLQHYCGVHWRLVAVAGETRHARFRIGEWPTLEFTALALNGAAVGETIALVVRDTASGRRLLYLPALDGALAAFGDWMDGSDCIVAGGGCRDRPGKAADAGVPAWLDRLLAVRAGRKVLLPPPRAAGCTSPSPALALEIAYDGMQIEL